jgi:hypothetical protein
MTVDFQRLARVQARRRRRRLHALSVVSVVLMLMVGLVLTRLAVPVLHSLATVSGAWSLFGEAQGETQGRVEAVEPETGIVHLSSGFLGFLSVALVVTPDTLIVVGKKEGGLGDLRSGEHVRAAYEIRTGALRAKRVELLMPGQLRALGN